MSCCIVTDTVRKKGYGAVDNDRLQKAIEIVAKVYDLPRQPTLSEVYDGSYLPPAQDRMLK
jgi:NitT/TauT family transport system substrate-binding protein